MKKPAILSVIIILFGCFIAKADSFILNGDTSRFWYTSPLKQYPDFNAVMAKLTGFEAPKCFDCNTEIFDAEWTVINNELYLTNIYNNTESNAPILKADINKIFNVANGKVRASWVTQKLWIPIGKPVGYIGMIQSLYKAEICFTISKGKIVDNKRHDYPKNSIYVHSMDQENWKSFIYSNINWKKLQKLINKEQRVILSFTTGRSNNPEDVKIIKPNPEEPWNGEVKRVAMMMPWPVAYIHGKIYKQSWTLPLKFIEINRIKYAR